MSSDEGVVSKNPGAVLIGAIAILAFSLIVAIGAMGFWSIIGGLFIIAGLATAFGVSWGEERNITPASVMLMLIGAGMIAYDMGMLPGLNFSDISAWIPYIAAILLIIIGALITQFQPLAGGILIILGVVLLVGLSWWNSGGGGSIAKLISGLSETSGSDPIPMGLLFVGGPVSVFAYYLLRGRLK